MNIEIKNGDYEVLSSGTIVGVFGQPIEFKIGSLKFIFEFEDDSTKPNKTLVKVPLGDTKMLKLVFYNFNNNLGVGNIQPLSIGTIGGKRLFLNYRVYFLSHDSGKTIHYSFLLKKEAEDGK
jgi:hypothetical protein